MYYYKEKGHWKNECPKKKNRENKSGSGSTAVVAEYSNSEDGLALVAN